ncbi:MAG: EAL domain-containing protein [Actinomycetota bacterium]
MQKPDDDDLMHRQALMYAKELRLLYGKERADGEAKRQQRNRILRVLDGPEVAMVFQPIVDLEEDRVVGLEALARFKIEPRQPPDAWFADAARAGLAAELELLAFRLAVESLDQIPDPAFLSVNLSPETATSPIFAEMCESIPTRRIVVEVTEHAEVPDYDPLMQALRTLRNRGGRLAVDDAGAGFASLRHILRLSPDFIKLDISLTHDVVFDRAGRALARAMIAFAFDIGKTIVAEGIETREQVDALRALGVRYGQGYYLARPGPLPLVSGMLPSGG